MRASVDMAERRAGLPEISVALIDILLSSLEALAATGRRCRLPSRGQSLRCVAWPGPCRMATVQCLSASHDEARVMNETAATVADR